MRGATGTAAVAGPVAGPPKVAPWGGAPLFVRSAVLAVIQVVGTVFAAHQQDYRTHLDPAAILLLAAGPAALVWRRRHPRSVLAAVLVVTLLYVLRGYPYGPVFVSMVVAFFAAVAAGHRVASWTAAAALFAGHLTNTYLLDPHPPPLGQTVGLAAWLLVVLVLAEVVRVRREQAAAAARTRQEEARRRLSEERLAIARELHDVLAHSISMINVQAGVGLELMDSQPEQARRALAAIKEASKDALTEVRSVLGVLRQVDEAAPRGPAPSLARLDELVSRSAATGLAVRTEVEGDPRPLSAGVDLAAFRIVQEALTNVRRHAGADAARVRVVYGPSELTVQVDDTGRGAPAQPAAGGNGIRGMRERAAALGGELEAGPRPGGGFRVRARLPSEGVR